MNHKFAMILIIAAIIISGCTGKIQKPTVSVDGINVRGVTLQTLNLDVHVIVDNPNSVSANLTKITFDIYYLEGSEPKYLGHGEKYNVDIKKEGQTSITIPVAIENQQAIKSLIEIARKGTVTIRVKGSADLDLKVTTYTISFEVDKQVTPENLR